MKDSTSSFSMSRRICTWSITAIVGIGPWVGVGDLHAQPAGAGALEALPYKDPQPLQDLLALDDGRLQRRLDSDWSSIRRTLDGFVPPGTVITSAPRVLIGSQHECLRSRSAPACRVYLASLVEINREKQQQGGVLANPLTQ